MHLSDTFSDRNKQSAERHAFWIDHEFLRVFYQEYSSCYLILGDTDLIIGCIHLLTELGLSHYITPIEVYVGDSIKH